MTEKLTLLIDPLTADLFMGGIAEVFPRREVDTDVLCDADALLITHFHPGHLEVASLAKMPRDVLVLSPPDPTIEFVLVRLGFTRHRAVVPGQTFDLAGLRLTFTGSGLPIPYVGVIVQHDDKTFWHMGDRGDTLDRTQIGELARAAGGVDLLINSHPSDMHSFLLHGTLDGGAYDGDEHERWLERCIDAVVRVRPSMFVPGTSSFRYRGSASWLNRFMHPMRPAEFLERMSAVEPAFEGAWLKPGDAIDFEEGRPRVCSSALPFIRALSTEDDRALDPTFSFPDVADMDPEGVGADGLASRLNRFVSEILRSWCAGREGAYADLRAEYGALGLKFALTAVLPGGGEITWLVQHTVDDALVERVDGSLPSHDLLRMRIAASTLDRWARDRIPYFVATVDCRRAGVVHAYGDVGGRIVVRSLQLRDPVSLMMMSDRERLHRWLARTIHERGPVHAG